MKKILITILVILVGLTSGVALSTIYFTDKIIPGIKIAGIGVGGLDESAATEKLMGELGEDREMVFGLKNREWIKNTASWDFSINYKNSVNQAMKIGRDGGLIKNLYYRYQVWQNGYWLEPIYSIDKEEQEREIELILSEIEIPAMEPQIVLEAGGKVKVSTGVNGVIVDRNLLWARIQNETFGKYAVRIEIPAVELKPAISEAQVSLAFERAQKMVGKKVEVVNSSTKQKWIVSDKEILFWMDPGNDGYKNDKITKWLNELAPSVNKPAQNASFTVIGDNKLEGFKPEVWGLALNAPGSYEQILDGLNKLEGGQKSAIAELTLVKIAPQVSLSEVSNLGLQERLGIGESWFSGSITNRIYNLKKAATELNGVIIAPGDTFSFNKQVGEISSDTGYRQAYIIKEGKTILGDGGGVCQVSSTLFRAVLATGLPIVERTAHAFRVSYYEEKYQPGFDATIFQPSPDFKFKNDTPAHLLIQMVYDEKAKYLAFEIYGTSDDRKAELSKARIWDQVPPPPDLFIDDPNLPAGKVVQTEHSAWGAKVAFDYKVTRGDEVLQERTFVSAYRPWQAVYLRGTKI